MNPYEYFYEVNLVRTAKIVEPDDFVVNLVPHLAEMGASRILDAGCGAGRNAIFLAKQGFHVVGLDISSTALKLAQERANEIGLRNFIFVEHSFSKMPFPDDQFDAVISCYSVENVPLPETRRALGEMRRVIKQGGLVLVTLHSVKHWRFGKGERLGPKTFMNYTTVDGKRFRFVTHFFEKEDVLNLFSDLGLDILSIEEVERVSDKRRVHWVVLSESK
jgi:ubiquinone/menaquinone biosynthesis C-methylase UbiE